VVQNDLFGTATIVRYWGSRTSHQGGMITEPYSPERMQTINKERLAHGYELVKADDTPVAEN
jgi:hypothetical protein